MAVGSLATTSLVYNLFVSRLTPLHLALGSSCHIHSRKFWRRILRIGVCCIAVWNIKCKCGSNCAVRWSAYSPTLHSPPVSTDILPRIPGNQDVEQRRVGRRERMFMTSPHSLPLFTTYLHGLNGYTLFIQLQEGFMQRSNNVTSHHLCSKVVMSGSKRNQTVK